MAVMGFTKLAILMLYLRLFPSKPFRRVCLATIGLCVVYIPTFVFSVVFHCTPIKFGWVGWAREVEGHCINFNAFAWAHAIINIVFDLWVILLPVPQLLKLSLGRRK